MFESVPSSAEIKPSSRTPAMAMKDLRALIVIRRVACPVVSLLLTPRLWSARPLCKLGVLILKSS